jgi:phosphoglycolate phosphatase
LKAIIFDFDGTMVRSHVEVYEVLKELALEYGFKVPEPDQLRQLSTMELIKTLGVRVWQVPRLTSLARAKLKSRTYRVSFEPGMLQLISDLRENTSNRLALVSSNSIENVKQLLERENATHLFNKIVCGSSMLGKHRNLLRTIRGLGVSPTNVIYIGDETRDITAAKKIGIRVAAVSWGFHALPTLQAYKPDYIFETVDDLALHLLN